MYVCITDAHGRFRVSEMKGCLSEIPEQFKLMASGFAGEKT